MLITPLPCSNRRAGTTNSKPLKLLQQKAGSNRQTILLFALTIKIKQMPVSTAEHKAQRLLVATHRLTKLVPVAEDSAAHLAAEAADAKRT